MIKNSRFYTNKLSESIIVNALEQIINEDIEISYMLKDEIIYNANAILRNIFTNKVLKEKLFLTDALIRANNYYLSSNDIEPIKIDDIEIFNIKEFSLMIFSEETLGESIFKLYDLHLYIFKKIME